MASFKEFPNLLITSDNSIEKLSKDLMKHIHQLSNDEKKSIIEWLSQSLHEKPNDHKDNIDSKNEDLLTDNHNRYVLFPINPKYQDVYELYRKQETNFWTAPEIDFVNDLKDWNNLSKDEQHFIKMVLAFFAASDGIVLENLGVRFLSDVKQAEVRMFYGFQIMMEGIHSEAYSLMIDTYVPDNKEKDKLFNSMEQIETIGLKGKWAIKWIESDSSFAKRLLAFACVEGIFFSGSFCAIFWLKKRGIMPGLTFSNELISRDEGLHTDFACLLYSKLNHKLDQKDVHNLVKEAVDIEQHFVSSALPVSLIGMNATEMKRYIEFVADRLLVSLGYDKLWNTKNPFPWMDMISLRGKTNFHEKRVGDYRRANLNGLEKLTFGNFDLEDNFV